MKKRRQAILLVDDSALITERVIDMLRDLQSVKNIVSASNYNEAVEVLREKTISTVLIDIQLQEKNGIELLKYIRRHYPDIVVIMLTNLASKYYRSLCKKAGARYFIDKSSEFDELAGILNELG